MTFKINPMTVNCPQCKKQCVVTPVDAAHWKRTRYFIKCVRCGGKVFEIDPNAAPQADEDGGEG